MAIIVDADVIIRGERGTFDLKGWLSERSGEPVEIAAITVAELWHCVEGADAAYRSKRETYVRSSVERMSIIPYTETTALIHARIWAALEMTGRMISDYDLIVAATALERGSTVATFNQRHFSSVRGLKVIQPKA
ncbi:MAG TPA: PIN domain-containing protein [Candidatus Sulfotelmatobacter sp.]|jgi:tRNA(fMet)-specific endonuclease VapC